MRSRHRLAAPLRRLLALASSETLATVAYSMRETGRIDQGRPRRRLTSSEADRPFASLRATEDKQVRLPTAECGEIIPEEPEAALAEIVDYPVPRERVV
jgi:hypothetical protein